MTDQAYAAFRLNFEQQQKRAKDLLKAARAGDAAARGRFKSTPQLAEAQRLVAQDLRFASWAELKQHLAAMASERAAVDALAANAGAPAMDDGLRTLHVRCGSDFVQELRAAGFRGEFYEHSFPYLAAPVRDGGPGCLEERARFLVARYAADLELTYDTVLANLRRAEERLIESADFERVVIWSEHDCYDQLVLLRLLSHYATHRRPPRLELVNVGAFPGNTRFIGLGQLPPEALRMLWSTRRAAGRAELAVGLDAWRALASADPRKLAALMRGGTPVLPLLAPALGRHLRELPSIVNGLSLTEQLVLELLAQEPRSLERVFVRLSSAADPLPGQGDLEVRERVRAMERVTEPVLTRVPGIDRLGRSRPPWTDMLAITDLGRAVVRGDVDFRSLAPPQRWVGGVEIGAGRPDWRWDERRQAAVLLSSMTVPRDA